MLAVRSGSEHLVRRSEVPVVHGGRDPDRPANSTKWQTGCNAARGRVAQGLGGPAGSGGIYGATLKERNWSARTSPMSHQRATLAASGEQS
jgi:hypothetical protein